MTWDLILSYWKIVEKEERGVYRKPEERFPNLQKDQPSLIVGSLLLTAENQRSMKVDLFANWESALLVFYIHHAPLFRQSSNTTKSSPKS